MNLKREVTKRLTPYMKSNGYMLTKGGYCYILNDVAYCIGFDAPSGVMYVTEYIIPLFVPCEGKYYTYGKRINACSLFLLSKDVDISEIDNWCTALCQHFKNSTFPFFERINSPKRIVEHIEQSCFTGIKEFSCPPIYIERLKLFTYLYLRDLPRVRKTIDFYCKSVKKTEFLTDFAKKKLLDEIDIVESVMQKGSLEILSFCTQIMDDTKKYF